MSTKLELFLLLSINGPHIFLYKFRSSMEETKFKYDVFLSFRGEDTRNNFVSHLHKALCKLKIETFIDYELKRGDEISPSLIKAIEESHISLIIFSEGYATSRWCLEELVKILQCKGMYGQIVIPVFYEVDPSVVRNQIGSFAEAFAQHEEQFKESLDKVQKWKDALKEAANLSGFASLVIKPESLLIDNIVQEVVKRLIYMNSTDNDGLIGIDSKINEVQLLLQVGLKGVCSVGIWGVGGIGKTTLAGAVFDKMSNQFEASCFIHNVREESEQNGGLDRLRKKLYQAILGDGTANTSISNGRCTFTKKMLGRKTIFVVFDDVTNFRQIEYLIGGFDCLGSGSRVIMTTRDRQVLKNCWVGQIYEIKDLPPHDAFKLFCQYAFRQNQLMLEYEELAHNVVNYLGGIPLALKVIGSSLFDKGKEVWESSIRKLEKILDKDIYEVLKISYDGLSDGQQEIFLDISCLHIDKYAYDIKPYLSACGFFTDAELSILVDKCLIVLESGSMISMHDVLRAMGREIVRQQSIDNPGQRTRLWHHEDIYHVLTKNLGSNSILGISFDVSEIKDLHLNPAAFANMQNVRFFEFYLPEGSARESKVHLSEGFTSGGLEFALNELRYLDWYGCPFKYFPSNFRPEHLVRLTLCNSNLKQLWDGVLQLVNLKLLDFSRSAYLISCPDLSGACNLESIDLSCCTSLLEIPCSLQCLSKLTTLRLECCESLKFLPDCFEGLISLTDLDMSYCSHLQMLPEMPSNIEYLGLSGTSIEEMSPAINNLSKLRHLNLSDCSKLKSIPDCFGGLKALIHLDMSGCSHLEILPKMPCNIGYLDLSKTSIEELSPSIDNLSKLGKLRLQGCSKLKFLPSSLWTLQSLHELDVAETAIRELPPSIVLSNLAELSFKRCKLQDSMNLFMLGSCRIKNLNLTDCGIMVIPDSLSNMSQLEIICLGGNNFESIPSSMVNLSNLKYLDISYCQRLLFLPQLPSISIYAANCFFLASVPFLSVRYTSVLYSSFADPLGRSISYSNSHPLDVSFFVSFANCFNLYQNGLKEIIENVLQKLPSLATFWAEQSHPLHVDYLPSVHMCFPGSEVPEWFSFQGTGSSITMQLPPGWNTSKFVGFALCAVTEFQHHPIRSSYDLYIVCECILKSINGQLHSLLATLSYQPRHETGHNIVIESDHLSVGCDHRMCHRIASELLYETEATFVFNIMSRDQRLEFCKVKSCGVRLMYAENSGKTNGDFSLGESEDEPHKKRLKSVEFL